MLSPSGVSFSGFLRHRSGKVFCEVKPTLSDDYPVVLRKLRNQIALTSRPNNAGRRTHGHYVLIVGSFTSKSTTVDELITIFRQHDIRVIFACDILGSVRRPMVKNDVASMQVPLIDNGESKEKEDNKQTKLSKWFTTSAMGK